MKNTSKKIILILVLVTMLLVVGVTYAFYEEVINGEKTEVVTGQIYMDYKENSQISLKDMLPETKEEALKRNDDNGVFNFTITGRNTSKHPIYYGISLVNGDVPEGKTTLLKPEHIMIYLERDGEVLIDGIRYSNWDNQRIWVETIDAGTKENIDYNYTLRMWIDTEIMVSDTNPNRDYTVDEWNNAYASLKVNVNGNIETMNMPLSIETSDTFVENNNAYFIAKISNFYDINDLGKILDTTDNLKFQVTGTNSDMVFSYKDSEGNIVEETSETLDLEYLFNKNKTIEVQVFVKPKNDSNGVTDLTLKLIKNGVTIQDFHKRMNVYGNNFCLNNGLNKLYDCILASDSLVTDVETAKVNIANKGEPDLSTTAPNYTYVEVVKYNQSGSIQQGNSGMKLSTAYSFDNATGTYYLENPFNDDLSDDYINYYTCGNHYGDSCLILYKIKAIDKTEDSTSITKFDNYSSSVASAVRSEIGLYKNEDDYGDSFIYRGDVKNNNVVFGGYYWKIIRVNGNGSIRMIYNGKSTTSSSDAYIASGKYNDYKHDPTYVGYMYGQNFELKISSETYYTVSTIDKYYYSTNYEYDETTKKFNMTGDMIQGTAVEMKDLFTIYPYTCLSKDANFTCDVMTNVISYRDQQNINVKYISYSSKDLSATREDNYDSNAKKIIDEWYENNILNGYDDNRNKLTTYISDEIFCNDRTFTSGDGYSLDKTTNYSNFTRYRNVDNPVASLKCPVKDDSFTVSNSKGNQKLTYPIALITYDELTLAGGRTGLRNSDFYLNSNNNYFTMTPMYYVPNFLDARMGYIELNGSLQVYQSTRNSLRIRPVINIRSDVLISSGDGTTENPFTLQLA